MFTVGEIRKFGLALGVVSEFFTHEQETAIRIFMARNGAGKKLLYAEAIRTGTGIGDLELALISSKEARLCKIALPALKRQDSMLSAAWSIYAADSRILRDKKTAADIMREEIEAFIAKRKEALPDIPKFPTPEPALQH